MFGAAIEAAGVQTEQWTIETNAARAKALARAFAHVDRKANARDLIDDSRRVHRCQQRGVVVELMTALALASDTVRQQEAARIARVSPTLADAGGVRDHRGTKRIRQDDGAAEASRLQQADAIAQAGVPWDDFAEQTRRREKRRDVLRRSDRDAAFTAEAVVQRAISR